MKGGHRRRFTPERATPVTREAACVDDAQGLYRTRVALSAGDNS